VVVCFIAGGKKSRGLTTSSQRAKQSNDVLSLYGVRMKGREKKRGKKERKKRERKKLP
jgi:hypothetical protein